ncbi:hypothetical protein [Cyclobacterium sp.]|uniref:hypothetical protein n=1 Tax=Cyclobacterium sp. TaxID=1966343 RepID=UPI001987A28A|nr:hypothetical protein [Cyclobacterium sp.]MBD3627905.1 hypothetical protein [Cyclobacterium sp.]
MKRFYFILLFCFLCLLSVARAQDFAIPAEGKSLVYFVRSSGTGALINFKYFDGENYLGKFRGRNYFMYECDPGEHVFWVTSENRAFVEASLMPDKVYFIEVRPTPGALKAAVRLIPIDGDDARSKKRLGKTILKRDPVSLQESDFSTEAEGLEYYIQNGMKKYLSDKEKGKKITQLPANFYHN